ncbi:hypothetical protein KUTeg_010860 [Tegillarca granosa]|uniref:Uncharacterized protein n=1 Tax=Tegillarca granosa TaxID=220873 RepID=A0ABQ9F7F6_TEGGR|nr:hypothetical protein KUTeg_010860 [Tegillarca granosa]
MIEDFFYLPHRFDMKLFKTSKLIPLISIYLNIGFLILFLRLHLTNTKYRLNSCPDQQRTTTPVEGMLEYQNSFRTSQMYVVPNIVHFVWFGKDSEWYFHQFLSVLSAYKNIKPNIIYFHCDNEPIGEWWIAAKKRVKTLKIRKVKPPDYIFDRVLIHPEHKSDIFRIEVLQKMGGIYLDTDVIALKSFNPLRNYTFTMGLEYHGNPGRVNNGVIISAPNATFLNIWKSTYKTFTAFEWDYHSCAIPYLLRDKYPDIFHVEERSLVYPSGPDKRLIHDTVYDWSNNYAIHLWHRTFNTHYNPESVKMLNTTYGQIARFVLYNNSDLIPYTNSVYY